jgi:hypothetical protein
MLIDYFNGYTRARSLGTAAQIKIIGEPSLILVLIVKKKVAEEILHVGFIRAEHTTGRQNFANQLPRTILASLFLASFYHGMLATIPLSLDTTTKHQWYSNLFFLTMYVHRHTLLVLINIMIQSWYIYKQHKQRGYS